MTKLPGGAVVAGLSDNQAVRRNASALLLIGIGPGTVRAQSKKSGLDLMDMNFEDLMAVQLTSVSKKEQKLSETPAAIYVITEEEIRRAGVNQRSRPPAHGSRARGGAD